MRSQRSGNSGQGCRIIILGGGYAALAAVIALRKLMPASRTILLAPRKAHIKIPRLQETLRYSLRHLCVPYNGLGRRFEFDFIQAKIRFDADSLLRWQRRRCLVLNGVEIPFDYLLIATGADSTAPEKSNNVLTVRDFCLNQGQTRVRDLCQSNKGRVDISVVGGGATGIQFLFELSDYLKTRSHRRFTLRLVDFGQSLLGQFPQRFHDYALKRLQREGVEYLPNTACLRQENKSIVLSRRDDESEFRLSSDLTLQFLGVKPTPIPIKTNCFGQVIIEGQVQERIFAAGDCAHFAGSGANTLSAQVAVRKGRLVAGNLARLNTTGQQMKPYDYMEKGYIVSLGPSDAIGWLGSEEHIITGMAALALKKGIDSQYDLLLAGIDTYEP